SGTVVVVGAIAEPAGRVVVGTVVVLAGAVVLVPGVVVVASVSEDSGGTGPTTGRNRISAVWPTSRSAAARSFTPGRSTTMSVPWREISGSATPRASTRLRITSTATSSAPALCTPTGESTT